MKSKTFGLFALSILTLVFFMGLTSAAITFSDVPVLTQDGDSFTITATTNETETINFSADTIEDSDGNQIVFTALNNVDFTTDLSQDVEINYIVDADFEFDFEEEYSTILTASGSISEDATKTLYFEKIFCDYENPANLEVEIDSIDVKEGFGDDEDYWYPLDEVEIDVEIKDPDYDVENIEIEFCLYDVDEKKCILDEGDIDISEDDFDLDENDDITTTLSFKVDPDELTAGNTDYKIYVKATGEIDDSSAGEYDEDKTCASVFEDIEIRTNEKFVIIDDIELSKETVQCGEELRITADVWNIGDEDLDDDEVFIWVFNRDLKIDEEIEFVRGIDSMDKEVLDLVFQIPEELEEQFYSIEMTVYDDEDMGDSDIYENKEEDKAEYFTDVKVEGNCGVGGEADIIVSASLESEAKAGKEMVISVLLTNTADSVRIFTLEASGYDAWAELSELPGPLTVNADSSGESLFKFDVKSGISGEQTFSVLIYSDNELIATQPVSVPIEASRPFLGITGFTVENASLWGLGLLNVILIVIIIIVAVRIARK